MSWMRIGRAMCWVESPWDFSRGSFHGGFSFERPMPLRWDFVDLVERMRQLLEAAENELRLEQAVYGLDVRDERALQSLLAERLKSHYEIAREVHYPSTVGKKLTHRQRCDMVVTPLGRPLRLDSAPPTLFDPTNAAPPEEALWLEV